MYSFWGLTIPVAISGLDGGVISKIQKYRKVPTANKYTYFF